MFFKQLIRTGVVVALVWSNTLLADTPSSQQGAFKGTPNKCVTLRQGRDCYAKVTLTWNHPIAGDFCIVSVSKDRRIRCWRNRNAGVHRFEFYSPQSEEFHLTQINTGKVVAKTTIEVSWVYSDPKRKRRWRLF